MLGTTKVTRLKNGVSVVTAAIENAESVALGIWVGVGGRRCAGPFRRMSPTCCMPSFFFAIRCLFSEGVYLPCPRPVTPLLFVLM